jgi:predicted nucleic acid-binding Zn ribbon protein
VSLAHDVSDRKAIYSIASGVVLESRAAILQKECPHWNARPRAASALQCTTLMNKAGDILGRVVRKLDRPEAALAWLSTSWANIVGKALAAHTRPLRCEKGSLEISADSKAWQKQLEHMTADFRNRINQAWGGTLIREVKFVARKPGPKRIPYELDNEHTPFIRRKKS